MDARTYFLLLHEEAHFSGKARRVFELPTPEQWRTVVPGHNSIAWSAPATYSGTPIRQIDAACSCGFASSAPKPT